MSKKAISYVAGLMMAVLSLVPPIDFKFPLTNNLGAWFWIVLIAGFFGIYTLFLKINIFVKLIAVYVFISCFFTHAPFISFTAYIPFIACVYFYILCTKIEDWSIVFKILQGVLLLNFLLVIMQSLGKECLLNFGLKAPTCFGVLGNPMQQGSLIILLSAFLISYNKLNIIPAIATVLMMFSPTGSLLALSAGIYAYIACVYKKIRLYSIVAIIVLLSYFIFKHNVLANFLYARGPVWEKTLYLSLVYPFQHRQFFTPFFGWGISTFHIIFPALAFGGFRAEGIWLSAHNCWLQILFELGILGFSIVCTYATYLFYKCRKDATVLAGLTMVSTDMAIHFPTRMLQSVLIIIGFLAFCQWRITHGPRQSICC